MPKGAGPFLSDNFRSGYPWLSWPQSYTYCLPRVKSPNQLQLYSHNPPSMSGLGLAVHPRYNTWLWTNRYVIERPSSPIHALKPGS